MKKTNFTLFKKSWLSFLTLVFCMGFQLSYAQVPNCPMPGESVGCVADINVGLSSNCTLTITPDDLIADDISMCAAGTFIVDIAGTGLSTIQVGVGPSFGFQIGQTVEVKVNFADGTPACWGNVLLEDKTPPVITTCPANVTVDCNDDTSVDAFDEPTVSESCGGVTLTSSDAVVLGDCEDGFLRQITRTFIATNASGMTDECVQVITVDRQSLADGIDAPADFDGFDQPTISCDAVIALDENGNPSPTETGFPTIDGEEVSEACGLSISYEDELNFPCEGTTKIFRTFTITDWCRAAQGAANNRVEIIQFIKIEDKTGPVVDCVSDLNVSTDFDACTATVSIPAPGLSDNCASDASLSYTAVLSTSEGTLVFLPCCGYVAQDLPVGEHTITYTGVDACGNESFCMTKINVTDQVVPAMSCESFRKVSLQNINPNEPTIIFAEAFDDGSYDNCEIEKYEVRRMDSCIDFDWTTLGAGIDSDANGDSDFRDEGTTAFYPAVPFACCDIGNTVMVELRITDIYGNSNSCMVEAEVEDKVNPIVRCPADVTIECLDEIPGFDFLSADESATFNTPVFAGTPSSPGDFLGYYNGVIDNCGATLYISESGDLECGVGSFTRVLQAQDANGNLSTTCEQTITIVNNDPFNIVDKVCRTLPIDTDLTSLTTHVLTDDAEWPCDIVLECGLADPTPDALENFAGVNPLDARPQIQRNDICDQITRNFEDEELTTIGNEECRKILRHWIITDWCQFELNNSTGEITAGVWRYTQVIKIVDNTAPVLECPSTVSVDADPATCDGEVNLTVNSNTNNCDGETLLYSYVIKDEDGNTIGSGTGNNFSGTFDLGSYSITWSVEDYCGNVGDDCTQLFFVVDNTPPNIVALTQTDLNLANGQGVIWSVELEISSFDICSDTIQSLIQKPSMGNGQSTPPATAGVSAVFTCADLPGGASDALIPVDYWLQDGAGNWSYVTVIVNVDDSQGFCNNGVATASIAGTIATEENELVDNATISVDGSASIMPADVVTAADGAFAYDLELGQNYSIAAARNDNPLNGLTTYDLILLGQHLLEVNLLNSPYKMIAADVNASGSITSLDMIALRRMILFIDTEFPANTSWRFVDGDYAFPNAANPFATTFPEVINYNNLNGSQLADFVGIKIGDLNGSAAANALAAGDTRSSDDELVFNVEDAKVEAGQTYTVDFKAADFNQIAGYQFTLNFDANAVEFVDFQAGALRGLTADNFGFHLLNQGVITTSWNAANALSVSKDEVLFSLTFTAKSATQVSKAMNIAQSTEYTSAEAYNESAELYDLTIKFNTADNALLQNQPNPFRNETVIGFELAEAAAATVTIYDVAGRTIKQYNGDFAKGYNSLTINRSELSGSGVLYYQLQTADFSATKKMILVD